MSAQRGAGSCDAEYGLASYCGGVHLYVPRNLCTRAYSMLDLSSVVPAQCFAATMGPGLDLIKTWIPREIFFEKSSGLHP